MIDEIWIHNEYGGNVYATVAVGGHALATLTITHRELHESDLDSRHPLWPIVRPFLRHWGLASTPCHDDAPRLA